MDSGRDRPSDGLNAALLALVLGVSVFQFGLFPLIAPLGSVSEVLFVLCVALTGPLHYGLMHETMHGNLYKSEAANRGVGRLLGVLLGFPWETMRFGHLAHHGLNRHSFDRPEAVTPGTSRAKAAPLYYFMLIIGHALTYVLMPLPALLPVGTTNWVLDRWDRGPETEQLRAVAYRTFTSMKKRNAIRLDIAAIVVVFGLGFWLWSGHWSVLAAAIVARWSLQSLLDNAPHYGMPLDSGLNASNSKMPEWARILVLNSNYHDVHHHAPQLSWQVLPRAFAETRAPLHGSWAAAVLRQFRGPLHLDGDERRSAA